jgi:hypothetical protein
MSDDPAADEVVSTDATPADIVAGEAAWPPASPTPAAVAAGTAGLAPPVPPASLDTGYTPAGVPTFDSVREKIETRYGTAIGASELASETPQGRSVEEQYEARQRAAAERLEQIKKSMHADEPDQS